MTRRSLTAALIAAALCSPAFAQNADKPTARPGQDAHKHSDHAQHNQPAGEMDPKMAEMMQACMEAGTPGEEHEFLMKSVGTWDGKTKMWMMPGSEPIESTGTAVYTPVFEGRYLKVEMEGEMPGMGMFRGTGFYGFDNVSQEFVGNWIDNMSTGIMTGKGERSSDKKTMTWHYTYNCPVTKAPKKMREVIRIVDHNNTEVEMFGPDLEGNEYKMMEMHYTRRTGDAAAGRPGSRPGRPASTTSAPDR